MHLKDMFQAFAEAQGWVFDYGRDDFHNLINEADEAGKIYLLLDPVELDEKRNDTGVIEKVTYEGRFMLLLSSDLDEESYDYRYENYIKPLLNTHVGLLEEHLICEHEAVLETWKKKEVINVIAQNLDGLLIPYKISFDL